MRYLPTLELLCLNLVAFLLIDLWFARRLAAPSGRSPWYARSLIPESPALGLTGGRVPALRLARRVRVGLAMAFLIVYAVPYAYQRGVYFLHAVDLNLFSQ